jgi:hypothetical protein
MATPATIAGGGGVSQPPQSLPGSGEEASSQSQDLVLKVLGAVGAGVGVLGFVTLFGGAIIWVRANEAGLPANETVAVVPRAVLVTTGASFLVPAVLLALLVVVLISGTHMVLSLPARIRAREQTRNARSFRYQAENAKRRLEPLEQLAISSRELATKLNAIAEEAGQTEAGRSQAAPLLAQALAQQDVAQKHEQVVLAERPLVDGLIASADEEEAAREGALVNTPRRELWQHGTEYVIVFIVLALAPLLLYGSLKGISVLDHLILIAVALTAAALSLAVYLSTDKFLWLGVVAFMAVGIYAGTDTYIRTVQDTKVEPAAALLGSRPPVTGLFIAETSSDLYLGTFPSATSLARLLVIPLAQVTDLSVGPLLDPSTAPKEAVELARSECAQQLEKVGAKTAATPLCTQREDEALSALLGRS